MRDEPTHSSDSPTPSGDEDARLVHRVRGGDERAFELLVRRHLGVAHRVALERTGNRQDAEDACQEAFVKALTRIEDCRRPERFRAWLLTIVRNTASNVADRERRRRGDPLDRVAQLDAGSDPGLHAERSALRARLAEGVSGLPEMQRRVLLLHDYEGWSHDEIADELGVAAGTSRYHLHQARKNMRDFLEDDGPGIGGAGREA